MMRGKEARSDTTAARRRAVTAKSQVKSRGAGEEEGSGPESLTKRVKKKRKREKSQRCCVIVVKKRGKRQDRRFSLLAEMLSRRLQDLHVENIANYTMLVMIQLTHLAFFFVFVQIKFRTVSLSPPPQHPRTCFLLSDELVFFLYLHFFAVRSCAS